MTQASSQAVSSLNAVPQGGQAQSDWNACLVSIIEQLQNQVASLQSQIGTLTTQYNATFQSGNVVYAGNNQTLLGNINFEFGTNLPNPSGTPGPALLLGSGGGSGTPATFWIITDQAYDAVTPGNTLACTAGETQPSGTANGGLLWWIGGASFGGRGGEALWQGGTSLHGPGGLGVLQGGNNTDGTQPPGDAVVLAGVSGSVGANVLLLSTTLNGTAGVVRMANGSDMTHTSIMADFVPVGAASGGNQPFAIYLYGNGGFGTNGQVLTSQGPGQPVKWA